MKKALFLSIFILFVSNAIAQGGFVGLQPIAAFSDVPGNPLHEYNRTFNYNEIPEKFTGSYYAEEGFVPGTVVVENEDKRLKVFLRYNVLNEVIELKLEKQADSIYVLPNLKNLVYKTPAYSYRYNSYNTTKGEQVAGFFKVYFDGDGLDLVSKPVAHLKKESIPRSGYDQYRPAEFSVQEPFYLLNKEGQLKEVRIREKDFRRELENSEEMKEYFSRERIKDVEDVVKMLTFFEQQQKQS